MLEPLETAHRFGCLQLSVLCRIALTPPGSRWRQLIGMGLSFAFISVIKFRRALSRSSVILQEILRKNLLRREPSGRIHGVVNYQICVGGGVLALLILDEYRLDFVDALVSARLQLSILLNSLVEGAPEVGSARILLNITIFNFKVISGLVLVVELHRWPGMNILGGAVGLGGLVCAG